jgi:hypothetical protein
MKRNLFNSIKLTRPKTSRFDLTHDVKLSCNLGELVPVMALETMPGDKFKISAESLIRLAPLVSPVMHRMDVTIHYFFCPNRILWPNWENFITNTDVYTHPYLTMDSGYYAGTKLPDYMGIPAPIGAETEQINAMPFAAYQRIWHEYYRDQNLQGENPITLADGENISTTIIELRKRAWEHDYFTAALPWAQKGSSVDIPLGEGTVVLDPDSTNPGKFVRAANHTYSEAGTVVANTGVTPNANVTFGAGGNAAVYDPAGSLKTEVGATTINDLRRAFRLQEWLERAARGGTRYVESILSNFGIKSSDARLQRPEYITGVKSPVVISEVLNTTGTDTLPQGNMAGHGISVVGGNFGGYRCEEHGWIIGIMSIMPKTAYQQGIQRNFLKKDDFLDYPWPTFANIGEQEVLNKEVYAYQGADGNLPFGYVPRYAQYKFEQNRVAGEFRNELSFWHMGRIFDAAPALNEDFIKSDPTTRVFAVTDTAVDHLYCHVLNKVQAIRPLPYWGTPTI